MMMLMVMVPDRRQISHAEKLGEVENEVNPNLHPFAGYL